jgi:hypothetical protein
MSDLWCCVVNQDVANFGEFRTGEVRQIRLLGRWVNMSEEGVHGQKFVRECARRKPRSRCGAFSGPKEHFNLSCVSGDALGDALGNAFDACSDSVPSSSSFCEIGLPLDLFTPFPETKAGLVSPAALHYEATVATMR